MRSNRPALVFRGGRRWSTAFRRSWAASPNRLKAVLQRGPRIGFAPAVVLGLVLAIGCTDDKPKGDLPTLHPVKGVVVRGGTPVNGGSVRFHPDPEDLDLVVGGEVKADGSFELQTQHAQSQKKGPGAPAGTYRITYFPPLADQTTGPNPEPVTPNQTQTIQAGTNELTVELKK